MAEEKVWGGESAGSLVKRLRGKRPDSPLRGSGNIGGDRGRTPSGVSGLTRTNRRSADDIRQEEISRKREAYKAKHGWYPSFEEFQQMDKKESGIAAKEAAVKLRSKRAAKRAREASRKERASRPDR